jgi:DNA-binding winged helix-turn-helix (wHTH) protein
MLYRFGSFELDDQLFELRRDGAIITLQPRVFDLLLYLVRRREVVVTQPELLEHVWGGVVVTKAALAQAVMALRKALGDDGETPTYIETIRGRGYRFLASVRESTGESEPALAAAPVAAARVEGPPFIGRTPHLVQASERFELLAGGAGGFVFVTGEAGVGKTSFLEALAGRAKDCLVLRVHVAEGQPELWTVTSWLRELARHGVPLEGTAEKIAAGAVSASSVERFELADVLVSACAAAKRPVLVLVDDLSIADGKSHGLLALLTPRLRRLPILVCATYTKNASFGPSFQAFVGVASSEPSTTVVRLEPFDRYETALYLEARLRMALPAPIVQKIHDKTGGNALLLSQVASMRATPEWANATDVKTRDLVDIDTLREAVGHNLRGLSPDVERVLSVAAVFGLAFSVGALSSASGASSAAVIAALDEAAATRIVMALGNGNYRFAYPLVRDVLHNRLPALERAALHAKVALALEERLGSHASDHERVSEVAAHWVEAAGGGDVDRAVDWSLRAASLAEAAGDVDAAAVYAERGLAALGFATKPDADKRARLEAIVAARP